jgi:hypothetical protein
MGLGLPDGGHLTHGYYVRSAAYPGIFVSDDLHRCLDCQKENDRIVHLFPVPALRSRAGEQLD